jgi:fibronectin-binding autotransporter adhesin
MSQRHILRTRHLVLFCAGFPIAGSIAHAATNTWTGNGGAANTGWSTTLNWSPVAAPTSAATTSLLFAGAASLTPTQNIANPFTLNALAFDTTAGSFHLFGSPLNFLSNGTTAAALTQNSANGQIISQNLVLGNTFTIAGTGAGALTFAGALSGAGALIKNASYNLVLGGGAADTTANSMTGTITASAGTITLDKASGSAAISGDLVVAGNASISATRNNLLGSATDVTLNGSGVFTIGSATFSSLTVLASGGFGGGTYTLATNASTALTLGGGIGIGNGIVISDTSGGGGVTLSNNNAASSTITGPFNLGTAPRAFTVPDNTGSPADDLIVSGVVSGNSTIDKKGAGTLALTNAGNSYSGGTQIEGGTVRINSDGALGSFSVQFIGSGGTLQSSASFTSSRGYTFFSGAGIIDTGSNNLTFTGALANPGSLVKISTGSLTIGGGAADVNSNADFTGSVTVSAGTLTLDKSTNVAAIGGYLSISGGTVNVTRAGNLPSTSNVTLDGGAINLGPNNVLGSLTINSGGLSLGIAPLTLTTTGTALSLNLSGSLSSGITLSLTGASGGGISVGQTSGFSLAGQINLGGVNRTITTARGTGPFDLQLSGVLSNGGITKSGPGILLLSAAQPNTFTGPSTVSQGTLQLNDTGGVAIPGPLSITSAATVTLQRDEQIASAAAITVNAATLNLGFFNTQTIATPLSLANATVTGGTLNLNSDITIPATQSAPTVISSQLNLNGAINLNDFTTSGTTSTSVTGVISGAGSLSLHGNGNISIAGSNSNTFTGGANILANVFLDKTNGAVALPGPVTENIGYLQIDGNDEIATSAALTVGPAAQLFTGSFTQTVTTLNLDAFEFDGNLVIAPGGAGTIGPDTVMGQLIPTSIVNNGTLTVNAPLFDQLLLQNNAAISFIADINGSGEFLNNGAAAIPAGRTLAFNGVGIFNNGALTLAGGTLKSSLTAFALNNQNTLTGFGTIAGAGNFANSGYISVTGGALSITVTGSASNSGNIDVQPTGQLQLSTALTNTGAINLLGGQITNATGGSLVNAGSLTGRGTISVPLTTSGTLQPQGGALNITNAFTNNGLILLTPGSLLSGFALTNAAQIQGAGTISNFVINNGTVAPTGGTLAFTNFFSNNPGATILLSPGNTAVFFGSLDSNKGQIALAGGTFDSPSSFVNSAAGVISGRGTFRAFALSNNGQIQLSAGATDIYGPVTNLSGSKIIVSGGSTTTFYNDLTMNAGSTFQVSTNSTAVFFGNVHGTSFFTGPGTRDFEAGASTLGSLNDPGDTQVQQPASITIAAIRESSLTVNGAATVISSGNGGAVSALNTLSIGPTGKFDLNDNDLILPYTGLSPASTIRAYLQSGYNNGAWTGGGLASSAAQTDASHLTALGYAEASDVGITNFDAQPVTHAVLVKYTYYGDSSLDGKVDLGNDFNLFLVGYLNHASLWELGDYNYDGVVNAADFALFIDGYKAQGSSLGQLDDIIESSPLLSSTQKEQFLSAVPEPECGVFLAFGVIALRQRRRRCKIYLGE